MRSRQEGDPNQMDRQSKKHSAITRRILPFRWLLVGPLSLLSCSLILLWQMAPLFPQPVWLLSFCIALILSIGISFLSLQEQIDLIQSAKEQAEEGIEESARLESRLEETEAIYREKVARLEEEISHALSEVEAKDGERLDREKWFSAGLATLDAKRRESEERALSFSESLQTALSDLREERQTFFFYKESQKGFTPELPHLYTQLKGQFEEKKHLLEGTRKRLFLQEGQIFGEQKERELMKGEEGVASKRFAETLEELLRHNLELEQEIIQLEELVSRSFAKKKKKEEVFQESDEPTLQLLF